MSGSTSNAYTQSDQSVWQDAVPYWHSMVNDAQELSRQQGIGGEFDTMAKAQGLVDRYGGLGDAALIGMAQNTAAGPQNPFTGTYGGAQNLLANIAGGGGRGGYNAGAGFGGGVGAANADPGAGYSDAAQYNDRGIWQEQGSFADTQKDYYDRLLYNEGKYADNIAFNEQGPYQDASQFDAQNNPYMDDMVRAAQESVSTNLQRNILPSVGDASGGAGQYGSSRQGIAEGLALSDANAQAANIASQMYGQMYENNEQRRAAAFEGAAQRALAGSEGFNQRALENVNASQGRNLSAFEGAAQRALSAFEGTMGREYGAFGLGSQNAYNAYNDAQNRALSAFEAGAGRDFQNTQAMNERALAAWQADTQANAARDTAGMAANAQLGAAGIGANASMYTTDQQAALNAALGMQDAELRRMQLGQQQQAQNAQLYQGIMQGGQNLYNLGMAPDQAAWMNLLNNKQVFGQLPILTNMASKEGATSAGVL